MSPKKSGSRILFAVFLAGLVLWFAGSMVTVSAASKKAAVKVTASCASKTVLLKWKAVKNARGYIVCRTDKNGKAIGKKRRLTGKNTVRCKISGLKNGKVYFYRVAAYYGAGGKKIGPWSKVVRCKPYNNVLKKPSVRQNRISETAVELSWNAVKAASEYEVKYKKDGRAFKTTVLKRQKDRQIVLYDLDKNTSYYAFVRAHGTKNGRAMISAWRKVRIPSHTETIKDALLSQITLRSAYDGGWDNFKVYPREVAEAYANFGNNGGPFRSNTNYFLWLNLHCFRVYVFTRTPGSAWTLMDSWPCGIGSPQFGITPSGLWTLRGRQFRTDYTNFFVLYSTYFTGFGTNAIHSESIPLMEQHLIAGRFESAGCVRVDLEHARFVYENCEGSAFLIR